MKKMLLAMALLCGALTSTHSQSPYKIHTRPKLPARDALERMNLVTAWNTRVYVDGTRDGIFSVQFIPGPPNHLLVQTYKGAVYLFDADNGDLVWKTTFGTAYWSLQPGGFNSQSIFVARRNLLYVLNRLDGAQRVYTYNPAIKQADFGYELLSAPSGTLVADEDFLYVPMVDRIQAIAIPDFETAERARKVKAAPKKDKDKEKDKELPKEEMPPAPDEGMPGEFDSPQPFVYWGYRMPNELSDYPPLLYGEQLSILSANGTLLSINRLDEGKRDELFEFKVKGRTPSAAGQYRNMAYVGSDDYNLYAIYMTGADNKTAGELLWRHASGAPILRKPEVNDHSVYVAPDKLGLRRLDRASGREAWTNREANRFLAANNNYVYALDQKGKFNVLDARRGTTLATYDLSDWTIAMVNEWSDRLYFAANDGQILCLRHRDLTKPLVMKTLAPPKVEEKKKPKDEKKEEKKDDEKKEEKKNDKDKEKAAVPIERWLVAAYPPQITAAPRGVAPQFKRDDRATWAGR